MAYHCSRVDGDQVVKIADFGLSRDLNESDYYTSGDKQAKLPIKWMAPESMERRVYNARTDMVGRMYRYYSSLFIPGVNW